jgi:hypothetical protein
MPRPITEKDPAEHIAQLTRILREVQKNKRYSPKRKKALTATLSEAIKHFQEAL